jgi:hypothetical protein
VGALGNVLLQLLATPCSWAIPTLSQVGGVCLVLFGVDLCISLNLVQQSEGTAANSQEWRGMFCCSSTMQLGYDRP